MIKDNIADTKGDNMHTPDGFLTSWVCLIGYILSLTAIGYSIQRLKGLDKNKILTMAGLAALIFCLQMLNFPIASGTSGHVIGAALAAILLGPYAAVMIISSVLFLQSLLFADGGIMALGINILSMAVVASFVSHHIYSRIKDKAWATVVASAGSVIAASAVVSVAIAASGTIMLTSVLSSMLSVHALIGGGEAIITLAIIGMIARRRIEGVSLRKIGVTIVALAIIAPFAAQSPDGMESVALNLGFYERAVELFTLSPMPGYELPFAGSTSIVALIGAASTFSFAYLLGSFIRRQNSGSRS